MKATEEFRAYYSSLGRIRMLGGDRALDLSNTLHWRAGERVDFVPDYDALANWSVPALLLTESEAHTLLKLAERHQRKARDVHNQWSTLRRSLKTWLAEKAVNPKPPENHLEPGSNPDLIEVIASVMSATGPEDLFARDLGTTDEANLSLPLLRSAAAIMMFALFPPQGALRRCEADQCGGYFIDNSRAKPRRWCSMDTCGNRAKAKRHRETVRHHKGRA